jgi:ketosteroid isomerase-like protein
VVTTPFDAPNAELAWTFIQSLSEADDVDEGFTLLSDDFTYWSLYTRLCIDKDGFRREVDRRRSIIAFKIDLLRCINDGDTVVVEACATGTKPNGVQYETPYICVFETRDGLIVSLREYSDTRLTAEVLDH